MKYILKKNTKILILVGISMVIANIVNAAHPLVRRKKYTRSKNTRYKEKYFLYFTNTIYIK